MNKIKFVQRCKKEFDKATVLEFLISLFLSKKTCASEDYKQDQLTEHFSVLFCLMQLENTGTESEISEKS